MIKKNRLLIGVIVLAILLLIQQNFLLFKHKIPQANSCFFTDGFFAYYRSGYLIDLGYPLSINLLPLVDRISQADPKTLRHVKDNYGCSLVKDKNFVFARTKKIEDADPNSFHLLGSYAVDKNYVYFLLNGISAIKIDEADPSSFQLMDYNNLCPYYCQKNVPCGKDKNTIFCEEKKSAMTR